MNIYDYLNQIRGGTIRATDINGKELGRCGVPQTSIDIVTSDHTFEVRLLCDFEIKLQRSGHLQHISFYSVDGDFIISIPCHQLRHSMNSGDSITIFKNG